MTFPISEPGESSQLNETWESNYTVSGGRTVTWLTCTTTAHKATRHDPAESAHWGAAQTTSLQMLDHWQLAGGADGGKPGFDKRLPRPATELLTVIQNAFHKEVRYSLLWVSSLEMKKGTIVDHRKWPQTPACIHSDLWPHRSRVPDATTGAKRRFHVPNKV